MAQGVVIRFKADSTEYDAKLKRSIEQMKSMEDQAKKLQGSIDRTDEGYVKFVQSLGQMDTVAKSSKTALREYSEAILYLQQQYKALSDTEKSGDVGKAMAASIQQLKVRAAEAQDTIGDLNEELKHMASDTSFTDGVNLMTRTVGSCAAAIAAWTGDSKEMEVVIKDLAKIGTTVAAVDALTKAFQKQNLVLLKNPYVAATAAAIALGVALVKLSKHLNEASAAQKDLEEVQAKGRENATKEITRIQTLNNILHDNTRSMKERETALQEIKALVPEYHGALTTEGTLINDNTDALTGYVAELQRAATAQAAFDKMVEINKQKLAKQLELKDATAQRDKYQAEANRPVTREEMMAQAGSGRNVYGAVEDTKQTLLQAAQDKVDGLEKEIKEFNTELETLQGLVDAGGIVTSGKKTTTSGKKTTTTVKPTTAKASGSGFTWNDPNGMPEAGSLADLEAQAAMVRNSMGGATTAGEYKEMEAHLNEILAKIREIKGEKEVAFEPGSLNDLNQKLREAQETLANLAPDTEAWAIALQNVAQAQEKVNNLQKKIGANNATKEQASDAQQMGNAFSAAANIIGEVGGAFQQIEDPSAKIAGLVMQAIASVAAGLGEMLASPGATSEAWGWVALAVSGTATMLSTIAAIKSATSSGNFAEGGIIPGSSYSGDRLTANVNSGELILNRAQQSNIAGQLQSNPMGNLRLSTEISGSNLRVVLNNDNRSRGGSRDVYGVR